MFKAMIASFRVPSAEKEHAYYGAQPVLK